MLDRIKLSGDLLQFDFQFTSPLGIGLAIGTKGNITFTKEVELLNAFNQFSMLGFGCSCLDSLFAFLKRV